MAAKGGLFLIGGLVVAAAAAGGWYFGAPLYTLDAMQTALKEKDAATLSSFIDYEALRTDLRNDVQTSFDRRFGNDTGGLLGGAGALAMMMVDPMVDHMISPEGMQAMMGMSVAAPVAGVSISKQAEGDDPSKAAAFTIERDGFDTLRVRPKDHADVFALVFTRDGLSWKLTGVDLADSTNLPLSSASVDLDKASN